MTEGFIALRATSSQVFLPRTQQNLRHTAPVFTYKLLVRAEQYGCTRAASIVISSHLSHL
jgi:hypothetical protein